MEVKKMKRDRKKCVFTPGLQSPFASLAITCILPLLSSHLTLPPCSLLPLNSRLSLSLPSCSSLRGYLVAAPSVFRAGVEESVSVTIFNAKAETRVQVQLSVKGQTVAHSHGSVLGENKFFKLKLHWHSGLRLETKHAPTS